MYFTHPEMSGIPEILNQQFKNKIVDYVNGKFFEKYMIYLRFTKITIFILNYQLRYFGIPGISAHLFYYDLYINFYFFHAWKKNVCISAHTFYFLIAERTLHTLKHCDDCLFKESSNICIYCCHFSICNMDIHTEMKYVFVAKYY